MSTLPVTRPYKTRFTAFDHREAVRIARNHPELIASQLTGHRIDEARFLEAGDEANAACSRHCGAWYARAAEILTGPLFGPTRPQTRCDWCDEPTCPATIRVFWEGIEPGDIECGIGCTEKVLAYGRAVSGDEPSVESMPEADYVRRGVAITPVVA